MYNLSKVVSVRDTETIINSGGIATTYPKRDPKLKCNDKDGIPRVKEGVVYLVSKEKFEANKDKRRDLIMGDEKTATRYPKKHPRENQVKHYEKFIWSKNEPVTTVVDKTKEIVAELNKLQIPQNNLDWRDDIPEGKLSDQLCSAKTLIFKDIVQYEYYNKETEVIQIEGVGVIGVRYINYKSAGEVQHILEFYQMTPTWRQVWEIKK